MNLEKAFDRVPRKVSEWAMRKKGIPEDLARSVMSMYERAKTRVRVDSEFDLKWGSTKDVCCHLILQWW